MFRFLRNPLDKPLYRWNKRDSLTVRNLLAGGIHVFGKTDGGKTSSMVQIARAIMRYDNSSMLIMIPKRGELSSWLWMAQQCGRFKDVVLFGPGSAARFNMLGHEATRSGPGGGMSQNITRFIMEQRSVLLRESQESGGDSQEWQKQYERLLNLAVITLQMAGEPMTAGNLLEVIESAPREPNQIHDEKWQQGYCNRCLKAGFHRPKHKNDAYDFHRAQNYFLRFWPSLNDRTRSSIEAGTTTALALADTGICRELFGDRTNITPAQAIEGRKIVIVDMPPDEWGDAGRMANIGWKYLWQQEVLRRLVSKRSPLSCIWGDESSLWVSPSDSAYLSRCRSYRGCMVYLCQSLNSYREVLPSKRAEAVIRSMLGNFSHKLFFALGDYETAGWASALCGEELRQRSGGSIQHAPYDPLAWVREQGGFSSSFQEQYEPVIKPGEFMNGLRTGSPVNRYQVDAVLVRSGVPFSNGLNLLGVTFDQRR